MMSKFEQQYLYILGLLHSYERFFVWKRKYGSTVKGVQIKYCYLYLGTINAEGVCSIF